MELQELNIETVHPNVGQIPGLPSNPRYWSKDELELLKESIKETPELLEARGVIVVKYGDGYVILGGNMRYDAVKELGYKQVPCCVFEGLTIQKMREIVAKDNSSFGSWDMEALANLWDDIQFGAWGIKGFDDITPDDPDSYGDKNKEVNVEDMSEEMKVKFKLSEAQEAFVNAELAKVAPTKRDAILKKLGYEEDGEDSSQ